MSQIHENILSAIGHTPLVKLNKLVGPNDATVLVKCEFMNPGASIKDRMALYILEKAEPVAPSWRTPPGTPGWEWRWPPR